MERFWTIKIIQNSLCNMDRNIGSLKFNFDNKTKISFMKNLLLSSLALIISLFIINYGYSQRQNTSAETLSLLIGLCNDYGGKVYVPDHQTRKYFITDFYSDEERILENFKEIIKSSNLDEDSFIYNTQDDNPNGKMTTFIFSEKYYKAFNSYYKFKQADFMYAEVDDDEIEYKVLVGEIKKSKFKTKIEKIMFLKGAFIRHGSINDNNKYVYTLANSLSKKNIIQQLLRETGSKILEYKEDRDRIPAVQTIIFEPDKELKRILLKM